jgi:hypothetical protein
MPSAAPIRAKLNTINPISARSRNPECVVMSMLSIKRARFLRCKHRRLAGFHDVRRSAHRSGWVRRHHLAGHQPVEQVAQCR